MHNGNGKTQHAKELAAAVARMSKEEREALAARLPQVINPDGHVLSLLNTAILVQQSGREDLTIVAGFKQWIRAGRVVQKGEHATGYIRVPISFQPKDRNTGEVLTNPDGTTKDKALRFRFVPVFDVSQTEEYTPEPAAATA